MARYLKYSNPRVPNWLVLVVLLLIAGYLGYRHATGVPYIERGAGIEAAATLEYLAQELRNADEAGVRAATPQSLLGSEVGRFGTIYGLELRGTAPDWAGTRLHAMRHGREVASLTITSLHAGIWTTLTEEPPTRWELWWE
jgi:hypothetical protein